MANGGARLSRQSAPAVTSDDATKPPGLARRDVRGLRAGLRRHFAGRCGCGIPLPAVSWATRRAKSRGRGDALRAGHLSLIGCQFHVRDAMTRARALYTSRGCGSRVICNCKGDDEATSATHWF